MKLKYNELNDFLREFTYGSEFRVLDIAKDKDELKEVAKKTGLVLPSPDIAIFKSKYAFTDVKNLNGCRLPKEEVAKSLETLVHKPIDIDHLRKSVIGHYLYAELVEDTIFAYGAIYKKNFEQEFVEIEDLMNKGMLKTSFEAWGNKEFYDTASYDLTDIIWAGGGLLVNTDPAFPGASVTEMASQRVLELAKIMEPPKSFVRSQEKEIVITEKEKKYFESARFWVGDTEMLMRMMSQVACPCCDETYTQDVNSIDYQNGKINTSCYMCGSESCIDMIPKGKVTKENPNKIVGTKAIYNEAFINSTNISEEDLEEIISEEKIEQSKKLSMDVRNKLSDNVFAVAKIVENKITGKSRNIRMFPIHDATHVRNALSGIAQTKVQDNLKKMGINTAEVINKIEQKAKELKIDVNKSSVISEEQNTMEEKIKGLEQEIAKLSEQIKVKDTEIANLTTQVNETKTQVETANATVETLKQEKEVAVKEAKEKATLVANRRAELGSDHAKDLSDEDIVDNVKFENAKLKKEVAELKAKVTTAPTTAAVTTTASATALVVGSQETVESDINARQKKVREYAFGA